MRAEHRTWARTVGRLCVVALCSGVGVAVFTSSAGAAPTSLSFGAPTGSNCSEVEATFGQSPFATSALLLPDGLPFAGWNGVSLLGLLEGPDAGRGPLIPNCGDLTHGSTDSGLGASTATRISDTAAGVLSMSSSLQLAATNALTAGLGEAAVIQNEQIASSTFTPVVAAGDQSLTISVTYAILSGNPSSPIASFVGAGLDYVVDAQSPSCDGQNVPYDQSGSALTDSPGTYTATFEFSCPAGETLTASGPIEVELAETQAAFVVAGPTAQSFSSTISTHLNSASVTYS